MLERVIEPKEHGFPCDYTNMFLLQHSEYIPELLIESEEKYRFYAELKRSVKHTEINKDADNIGFEYRDVHFIFTDGNILAIKEGRIVEKGRFPILQEDQLIHIEDYGWQLLIQIWMCNIKKQTSSV